MSDIEIPATVTLDSDDIPGSPQASGVVTASSADELRESLTGEDQ